MAGEPRAAACWSWVCRSKVPLLLVVVAVLQMSLLIGVVRVVELLHARGGEVKQQLSPASAAPKTKECDETEQKALLERVRRLDRQLAALRRDVPNTVTPTTMVPLVEPRCAWNISMRHVNVAKCDLACLQREVHNKEEQERLQHVKASMCLTSASPCKIRNQEAVRQRKVDCRARKFDPSKDTFDIVIPWTNMSESSYFDAPHADFFKNLAKLRHPYKDVGSGRPSFSEVVFTLRSLRQFGFMGRVRRVYILYDDDQHGPPQFLLPTESRIVPLPASLLTAGTPFVNRRRRLHTTLAYLHHAPDLSDFVFFLPDDCMMMRKFQWSEFFNNDGSVANVLGGPAKLKATVALGAVLEKLFSRKVTVALDLHAPFFVKKCYLEEMEVELCRTLPYQCDPAFGPRVCALKDFHFQLWAQNYQAVREGQDGRRVRPYKYSTELHTNKGRTMAVNHMWQMLQSLDRSAQLWFNYQGNGVSDEYELDNAVRAAADGWYYRRFPDVAPWEVAGFMPLFVPPPEPKITTGKASVRIRRLPPKQQQKQTKKPNKK